MCVTRDEGEDEDEKRSEEDEERSEERRRRRRAARRGDVQEKQEPHTKDVGKNVNLFVICWVIDFFTPLRVSR